MVPIERTRDVAVVAVVVVGAQRPVPAAAAAALDADRNAIARVAESIMVVGILILAVLLWAVQLRGRPLLWKKTRSTIYVFVCWAST
jgi:hypothetical protein